MQSHGEPSGPPEASSLAQGFVHQALIYRSDDEFMDVALPFVQAAIVAQEPALVTVQERNLASLRAALGSTPPGLELLPADQWNETSVRTREKFTCWISERLGRNGGGRLRLIGEPPWAIGRQAQLRDWARYESVLNVAFASYPLTLICPYDARVLPDEVIAHARSTHPEIVEPNAAVQSDDYEEPLGFCERLDADIELPGGEPVVDLSFTIADLAVIRRSVAAIARDAGLERPRAEELALAVNEIVSNALLHGRPPARLRIWRTRGELVCEVNDAGDGIEDALAGQLTPSAHQAGGRGIWVTRQLSDAVEVRTGVGCSVLIHANVPEVSLTAGSV
jgi:anti-sigma regulatory factor (Ser/Thr protein kinase)